MRSILSVIALLALLAADGSRADDFSTNPADVQPTETPEGPFGAGQEPVLEAPSNADVGPSLRESGSQGPFPAGEKLSGDASQAADGNPAEQPESAGSGSALPATEIDESAKAEAGPSAGSEGWLEVSDPIFLPEMQELKDSIRRTMAYYFFRPENNVQRSPWGVMHCIVAYGVDTPFLVGDQQVNAISWLCYNGPCYNMRMLYEYQGRVGVRKGPGYQGHEGQFLHMLALSRVKIDYPLIVEGRTMSVADLVEYEKLTCEPKSELTFKLVGLAHYLDSEATWQDRHGRDWSIERLLKEEIEQPVVGACCGGTHRLIGLSYAVHRRSREGRPLTGQWQRADKYVSDFHDYTFKLQNSDGSFSTRWFEGPEDSGDLDRKLNTTGHVLEWLLLSLPKDRLTDPDVLRAVRFLNGLLWDHRGRDWEIGPRGHSLHALALYDERMFGGKLGRREQELSLARADGDDGRAAAASRTASTEEASEAEPADRSAESGDRSGRLRRFAR